jgi:hypothetical protein
VAFNAAAGTMARVRDGVKTTGLLATIAAAAFTLNALVFTAVGVPDRLPAPEPPAEIVPVVVPEPVIPLSATLPTGAAAMDRALSASSFQPSSSSLWPGVCSTQPASAWSRSARTPAGVALTALILPAGQGGIAFKKLSSELVSCANLSTSFPSADTVSVYMSATGLSWYVQRYEDIIVSAYTLIPQRQGELVTITDSLMFTLSASCRGDRSSGQNNPLFPAFEPYAPLVDVDVPVPTYFAPPPLPDPVRTEPEHSRASYPQWAALYPPNEISNPTNTPIEAAARKAIPVLVDPLTVTAPAFPAPVPMSAVTVPSLRANAQIALPAPSVLGPGCGWTFAGSQPPPVPTIAADASGVLDVQMSRYVAQSGDWLVAARASEAQRPDLVVNREQVRQWEDYDRFLTRAESGLARVEEKHRESVTRWYAYQPPAAPEVAVPDPGENAVPGSDPYPQTAVQGVTP